MNLSSDSSTTKELVSSSFPVACLWKSLGVTPQYSEGNREKVQHYSQAHRQGLPHTHLMHASDIPPYFMMQEGDGQQRTASRPGTVLQHLKISLQYMKVWCLIPMFSPLGNTFLCV